MNALMRELDGVKVHCAQPAWDGYNARPLSALSWEQAQRFASAKCAGLPVPSVGVDSRTGNVSFQWGSIKRNYLSVTFGPGEGEPIQCLVGRDGSFSTHDLQLDGSELVELVEVCR